MCQDIEGLSCQSRRNGRHGFSLSISASIAGLLTFLVAILATLFIRFTYLRNAHIEYFRVKSSLSWFKTESTFMSDLLASQSGTSVDTEIFNFVMEDLTRLELRLLEVIEEAELGEQIGGKDNGWTIVPGSWKGRKDIAIGWVPVRAKALELVRQREALGSRVMFAQMSLMSSHIKDQERRASEREEREQIRARRIEDKLEILETLMRSSKSATNEVTANPY